LSVLTPRFVKIGAQIDFQIRLMVVAVATRSATTTHHYYPPSTIHYPPSTTHPPPTCRQLITDNGPQ
jgi:hypothetical protein